MRRSVLWSTLLLLMICSFTPAAAAGPELKIVAPKNGDLITGSNVTVEFQATGLKIIPSTVPLADYGKRPDANKPDEGHLHLALDLSPLVVWEKTTPYTFTGVPAGDHQLKVDLVNNDHSMRDPEVTQVIRFRTEAGQTVPAAMPTTGEAESGASIQVAILLGLLALTAGVALRRRVPS